MATRFKTFNLLFAAAISLLATTSCAPSMALDDWEQFAPHSGQSIFDAMNQQEVLEITLRTQLDSILDNRRNEEYTNATFTFNTRFGGDQTYQIKVKARGKYRRLVCDFPPLKLKFSKKELGAAGLEPFNELKLVTHCLDDENTARSIVMREYLAYKMYNELTPYSYRVQLVKINYRDTDNPGNDMTRWGFVIEDNEELTHRMGGVECDCMGQPADAFHPAYEKMNALYQCLIGNTDWSLDVLRNVKLVRIGQEKLIPVPYDFDFSQFVKAPYRRPNADVRQTGAMERVFMGQAKSLGKLYSTIAYFKSKRETLLKIVQDFKLLDETEKIEMVQYLDGFFQLLDSEESAKLALFQRS